MRRCLSPLALVLIALPLSLGVKDCPIPIPKPTPTPTPTPAPETCSTWVCPVGQLCVDTPEGPTCYTPTPLPDPQPKCTGDQNCGCYVKLEVTDDWRLMSCSEPKTCVNKRCTEPTPPPQARCPYPTPTGREALAQGKKPSINVQKEGAAGISGTPVADFGAAYYCSIGWAEACAEGKRRGPVAPDGDPNREACEAHFLEAPCPTFKMHTCGSAAPGACPITFDPYIVINGVNQNHPRNKHCKESEWVLDASGHVLKGQFWWATGHGNGTIEACNEDGSVCGVSTFSIDRSVRPE